jgi:hypothetical protein
MTRKAKSLKPTPKAAKSAPRKKPAAKRDKLAQYLWPTPKRPGPEPVS